MRRVIAGLLSVGDRYRILADERFSHDEKKIETNDMAVALFALVERGQREGAFSSAMSARWILSAMANLLMTAIHMIQAGDLARNQAAATVADTLLRGVGGPIRD
jgi:hypothetical protein